MRVLNHFLLAIFAFIFLNAFSAYAGPGRTTYQAKIIKPDGNPLEAGSVSFKFTIMDPSGSCILYSETFSNVNMGSTGGLVSFGLGSGIKTFPVSGSTFEQVFSNITPSLTCDAAMPATYPPQANDSRKIVMQFNDGAGWQTLPAMTINAVPYAMYANDSLKFKGMDVTDFVQVASVPTCTTSEAIRFNGVGFSCIAVGSGGTSVTSSTVATALGYTPAASSVVSDLSSSMTTTFANVATVSSTLSTFQSTVTASLAAITSSQWSASGTTLFYNVGSVGIGTSAPTSILSIESSATANLLSLTTSTNVNLRMKSTSASGTEWNFASIGTAPGREGNFEIQDNTRNRRPFMIAPQTGTSAPGYSLVISSSGSIGIGTTTPATKLDVSGGVRIGTENATCAPALAGTLRYNSGVVEYCNGTTWTAFGAAGAGVMAFNGLTSGSQTFANGYSGTAPNIDSTGSVHTFNIPYAASAGVTAGLVSNSDWTTFNNKLNATSAAVISALGYTPLAEGALLDYQQFGSSLISTGVVSNAVVTKQLINSVASSTSAIEEVAQAIYVQPNPAGHSSATITGQYIDINVSGTANNYTQILGQKIQQTYSGTGSIAKFYALALNASSSSGTVTNLKPMSANTVNAGANVTSQFGSTFSAINTSGNVTNQYGIHVGTNAGSPATASTTQVYGVYISNSGSPTNIPYDLYAATGSANNFFAGRVGIGSGAASPTARLQIAAGSATLAPLRFGNGPLLTTPLSGAVEYDGNYFYITDSTGFRKAIATGSGTGTIDNASTINSTGNITMVPVGSVVVSSTTASTNSQTGALIVKGGLGVAGNMNAASDVNVSGTLRVTQQIQAASGAYFLGNVGIGTSNPTVPLQIRKDGLNIPGLATVYYNSLFTDSAAARGFFTGYDTSSNIAVVGPSNSSGNLAFYTHNGSAWGERARLDSTGNFGIGTSAPLGVLHVNKDYNGPTWTYITNDTSGSLARAGILFGNTAGTAGSLQYINSGYTPSGVAQPNTILLSAGSAASGGLSLYTSNSAPIQFWPGGGTTAKHVMLSNGYVGIGTTTPSYPLEVVGQIKSSTSGTQSGFSGSTYSNTPWQGNFILGARYRGNSTAPLAVSSGDVINAFDAWGYDGSASSRTAQMTVSVDGNVSTGIIPSRFTFNTTDGAGVYATRMALTASGYLGIGTTSPQAKLHLGAGTSSAAALKFTSGTLLSSTQSGTMEYDGFNFYLTDGSGSRKTIPLGSAAGTIDNTSTINSTGNISLVPVGSVVVSSTTASTNSNTGALVVKGGVGVAGDLYSSGTIVTSSNIQGVSVTATSGMISPYIYGSALANGNLRLESTTHATKGDVLIATQGGNVGIGANVPASALHVEKADNPALRISRSGVTNTLLGDLGSTNHGQMNLYNASGTLGVLISSGQDSYLTGGNFGIGTNSPSTLLEVKTPNAGSSPVIRIANDGTASGTPSLNLYRNSSDFSEIKHIPGGGANGGLVINNGRTTADSGIIFQLNGTEKMRLDSAGNVGVGVSVPTARLHLSSGTTSYAPIKFTSGALLASTAAGAMEFDGFNFYLTDGAGSRKAISLGSSAGTIDNASTINSTGNITMVPAGSVVVSSTTASTNSNTGALVVKGGLGVAGNIYSSGTIITSSNIQGSEITATSATITPYVYGSIASGGNLVIDSTTHATKGKISLAPTGGYVGIGTNTPGAELDVRANESSTIMNYTAGNAGGSTLVLRRAGGSFSGLTPVTQGMALGVIMGQGYNGSVQNAQGADITMQATENWSATSGGTRIVFSATANGTSTPVERMRIENSGNVGIGTTSPKALVDVSGTLRTGGMVRNVMSINISSVSTWSSDANKHKLRILTNINYADSIQTMNQIRIYGYDYASASNLDLTISSYVFSGNFINYIVTNNGYSVPDVSLGNVGGKIAILLQKSASERWYYGQFAIDILNNNPSTTASDYIGWSYDDGDLSSAANVVAVPYKSKVADVITTVGGNVGIGITNPARLLTNTDSTLSYYNVGDSVSTGQNGDALSWSAAGAGYAGSFVNASTASLANGLHVRIAGTGSQNILALGTGITSGTNANDVFVVKANGNVGIGTSAPSAKLQIAAGTSGTAPLKFTSGTLLTSPQSGTMEYDGVDFYITDGNNNRRTIATASTAGALDNISVVSNTAGIALWPATGFGVTVSSTTASNSSTSGALVVKGGVGVAGNIYASGTIVTSSNIQGASITATSGVSTTVVQGTPYLALNPNGGNVGVGMVNPTGAKLEVSGTLRSKGHIAIGNSATIDDTTLYYPTSDFSAPVMIAESITTSAVSEVAGIVNYIEYNPSGSASNIGAYGFDSEVSIKAGNSQNALILSGGFISADHNGAGFINYVNGVEVYASTNSVSGANRVIAGHFDVYNVGAGTITNAYGLYTSVTGTSPVTNGYGVYIDGVSGTTSYGLYQASSVNKNYFAGNVGIGTVNPFDALEVSGTLSVAAGANNRVILADNRTTTGNANSPKLSFFGATDDSVNTVQGPSMQKINETSFGRGRLAFFQHSGADFTSESEVMSIAYNGNVGIGTTVPSHKLVVDSGANVQLKMDPSTGPYGYQVNVSGAVGTWAREFSFSHNDAKIGAMGMLANSGVPTSLYFSANVQSATTAHLNSQMVLTSAGNVGIGTSTPTRILHIADSGGNTGILLEDNSASNAAPYIEVRGNRNDGNLFGNYAGQIVLTKNRTDAAINSGSQLGRVVFGGNHTNGSVSNTGYAAAIVGVAEGAFNSSADMPTGFAFYTGNSSNDPSTNNVNIGTERMRISASGAVGIGVTNPLYPLDVSGTVNIASGSALRFGGTQICSSAGCTSTSDIRLKENIKPLDFSLEKILSLKGMQYDWKNKDVYGEKHQVGFIAQDLEKVFPEVVYTDKETKLKTVSYGNLIAPLVEAFKSMYAKILVLFDRTEKHARQIASLEAESAAKDQKIKELEQRLERIEKALQKNQEKK